MEPPSGFYVLPGLCWPKERTLNDTAKSYVKALYPGKPHSEEQADAAREAVARLLTPEEDVMRLYVDARCRNAPKDPARLCPTPPQDQPSRLERLLRWCKGLSSWVIDIVIVAGCWQLLPAGTTLPPVTLALVVLNVVSYVGQRLYRPFGKAIVLTHEDYVSLGQHNFERRRRVWKGQAYRYITHMFAHADAEHLAGNMLAFVHFGARLEPLYGGTRFLLLYLVSGVVAGMLSSSEAISLGASGAISGVIGAKVYWCFKHGAADGAGMMLQLFLEEGVLVPMLANIVSDVMERYFNAKPTARVAVMSHCTGLLAGVAAAFVWGPDYHRAAQYVSSVDKQRACEAKEKSKAGQTGVSAVTGWPGGATAKQQQ